MKVSRGLMGVSAIAALAVTFRTFPPALAQDLDTAWMRKESPTGSNIKRDPPLRTDPGELLSWVIPMDKTYDELTPAEKQMLRSAYVAMPDADEPPYPLYGMGKASEPVALLQHKYLAEGTLLVHVRVDQNGDALSAKIIKAPKGEIARAVATVLMLTRFKPAKCGDQRCEMDFPFVYTFKLK